MSNYVCNLLKMGMSIFTVLCAAGCTTQEIDRNHDNMVYVNQSSLNLFYGDTFQLTASPTESTFEWTSEDPAIATVDNNGLVTASGVGNTQITIKQGEWSKLVDVTVSLPTFKKVLARAGNKRVLIEVTIDNEKVQKMNIKCSTNNTSREQEVNYKSGVFNFYYDELEEDTKYDFIVTCIDRFENKAAAINVSAKVYGDSFLATLENRNVEVASLFGNGLVIKWKDIHGDCFLKYNDENGKTIEKYITAGETNSYLYDYGSELSYATFAVPENTAVDTFYVDAIALNIQAENDFRSILTTAATCNIPVYTFDLGGEGIGYHDSDSNNSAGNNWRSQHGDDNSPGVDIEGGMNIGYTDPGEWQRFTIDVKETGTYAFDLYRSVNADGKTNAEGIPGVNYSLVVDGVKIATVFMKDDSGWSNYKWQHETYPENQPLLNLTKGKHTVKFIADEGKFNYQTIRFTPVK